MKTKEGTQGMALAWDPVRDTATQYLADANPSAYRGRGCDSPGFHPEPRVYEVFPGEHVSIAMECEREGTPDEEWRYAMSRVDPETGEPCGPVAKRTGLGGIEPLLSGLGDLFPRRTERWQTLLIESALSERFDAANTDRESEQEGMIALRAEWDRYDDDEEFTIVRQSEPVDRNEGRNGGRYAYMLYKKTGKAPEPRLIATGTLRQTIVLANFVDRAFNAKIKKAMDEDHVRQCGIEPGQLVYRLA